MEEERHSLPEAECAAGLVPENAAVPKRRGLTLEALDRLSPSMVTLESLVSEWPANTYDSGYVPSPLSSGGRFAYPRDDARGISDECFECTPDANFPASAQRFSLGLQKTKAQFSPNVGHVTSATEGRAARAGTPPIKIPMGKPPIAAQDLDTSADVCGYESAYDNTNPYGVLDFHESPDKKLTGNDIVDKQEPGCTLNTRFVRPRTYSCPETSRATPNRPPVPLFPPITSPVTPEVFDRQYPMHYDGRGYLPKALTDPCSGKVRQYLSDNSKTPLETTSFHGRNGEGQPNPDAGHGQLDSRDEALPKVHTRFWSTPATTASDGRPLLVPPTAGNVKPLVSRDAIVDLSHEGPGHRRRVLVLSLPDVVVQASPSYRTGVDVTEDATPLYRTRESSSCSRDALGPLPGLNETSPVLLRPKPGTGRSHARPRALSCDVTLEETVGRALRHIADNFEPRWSQERRESTSLFGRVRRSVRRSFSRILNTGSAAEADQPPRNDVCQENLLYFPYDDLDDGDDFGGPSCGHCESSRVDRNWEGHNTGESEHSTLEYRCATHLEHSSRVCRLRLVETEVDGKRSYSLQQEEDRTYDFEYYL